VAIGNAVVSWGAYVAAPALTMFGMLVLGSGGGLLNGETQKAIMSVVPRERAGMASGVSTTSRFAGILLGFAVLSGVLATVTRNVLTQGLCSDGGSCGYEQSFADAVVAGDLPHAVAGLAMTGQEIAIAHARFAYVSGFAAALFTAAATAGISALAVYLLMNDRPR
jgi:hypothetical protein